MNKTSYEWRERPVVPQVIPWINWTPMDQTGRPTNQRDALQLTGLCYKLTEHHRDKCNVLWINGTSYRFLWGPRSQRTFYGSIKRLMNQWGVLWINWRSFGSIEDPAESARPPSLGKSSINDILLDFLSKVRQLVILAEKYSFINRIIINWKSWLNTWMGFGSHW